MVRIKVSTREIELLDLSYKNMNIPMNFIIENGYMLIKENELENLDIMSNCLLDTFLKIGLLENDEPNDLGFELEILNERINHEYVELNSLSLQNEKQKNKSKNHYKLIFFSLLSIYVIYVLFILWGICGIVSIIMGYDTPKHTKEYMIEIYSNETNYYNMDIEIESFNNYDDYYIVYFAPLEEYDFLNEYSKKDRFVLHKEMYEIATANGMELEVQKSYTISICLARIRQEDKPQVCSISSIDGSTEYLSSKDGIRIILEWVDSLKTMFL